MNNGLLDGLGIDRGFTVEPWKQMGGIQYTPVQATGSQLGATQSWPGSANTVTNWVEITPSSPFDCCAIDVVIYGANTNNVDTSALIDIGTGTGGLETVLIDGIPIYGHFATDCWHIRFPIRITAGTRFVWRMQAAQTSASITASPGVALGFIRDIADFPAGTSVVAVGTINRASSTYTNISTASQVGLRRNVWATVGDLPAGKVIYMIPISTYSSGAVGSLTNIADWGWLDQTGIAVNTAVASPSEIFASEIWALSSNAETLDLKVPTIYLGPRGLRGGCAVVACDNSSNLWNKHMCFAVVE